MGILELKRAAQDYYSKGLNIIPTYQKKPTIPWNELQDRRQTETEFNNIIWEETNGFALIGGSQLENGLYLGAIDFDVKSLSGDIVDKGKEILKYLPITKIEETPSGGQHWIYFCETKPKTVAIYHNKCAVELLGEKKLIIMAPSNGYKAINDNEPTHVKDLETVLNGALSKTGIDSAEKADEWTDREAYTKSGYSGKHPNCITKLMDAVEDGERNEVAIRLSSYMVNFRKIPQEKAWKKFEEWNQKNKPPLDNNELETIFNSAIKGKYVYGCTDSILKQHCQKECCPLAKRELAVPMDMVEQEVKRIFESDNIVLEVKKHLDNIISGEDDNKLAIFVLLLSGKLKDNSLKQMILLKGTEGSGKSTLMKIADFFNAKDVGRFSQHALDYTDLDGFEVLRLKELGLMDDETQGTSTVKFLSNDDGGYTVEATIRDIDTGRFVTEQKKIPPITVLTSTTRIHIDPQLLRRSFIINADESQEQTKKVLEWKVKQVQENNEVVLGTKKYSQAELSKEVLRQLVRALKPCKVIVPFPNALQSLLDPKVLRVRGDYDKILAFIKLYCFLNQSKLPSNQIDENLIIIATPKICVEALKIVEQPIASMASSLEKRSRELIEALKDLLIDETGDVIEKRDRDTLANKMGKSDKTVRLLLAEMENAGYMSSDGRKPVTYRLLVDLEDIERKISSFSAKLDSADSLMDEMEKETQIWLKTQLENGNQWIGEKYKIGRRKELDMKVLPCREF